MIERTIANYRILEHLDAGGVGMVYRAEDTRLRRTVALKFLRSEFTRDDDARERFIREAQAASALDHPNICTIFEIGQTEPTPEEPKGQLFIAMAFYQGETLKKKIARGPLSVEEGVDYARQIAEGLQAAHRRNIVHRDVKPANIMLTTEGRLKLLDFGIAKLAGAVDITRTGSTLGTAAYMSPEQIHSEAVDRRTDIWSLGVILYEMLAGERPFRGEYEPAMIYSVLNQEPKSLTALRPEVPQALAKLVEKLLAKDPSERYQQTDDMLADLKPIAQGTRLEGGGGRRATTVTRHSRPGTRKRVMLVALVAVTLLTVLYVIVLNQRVAVKPFTSTNGLAVSPTWSPDGAWIAYESDEAGNSDIWKKPLRGGGAVRLTRSPYHESSPSWSPDGRMIAFSSDEDDGGLFVIPSEGGTALRLTSFGTHPVWSSQNDALAFDWNGNIYVVPYARGEPRLVVTGTSATPHIAWMPDGERLLFWHRTKGDLYVVSLDNTGLLEPLNLIPSGQEVAGLTLSKDGRMLVFSKGPFGGKKNLWKVDIDAQTGKATAEPTPLRITATDAVQCAFSPDGSQLAFASREIERSLMAHAIDPTTGLSTGKAERLTFRSDQSLYPSLSSDGRMLVWTSLQTGQGILHRVNLETRDEEKVTRESSGSIREVFGSFAPKGTQLSYATTLSSSYEIRRIPSVGSVSLPVTTTQHPTRDVGAAWSPDGEGFVFYSNRSGNWDIWYVEATGQNPPRPLTDWESNEMYPAWSPDGRSVVFRTDKEGNADLWIMDADGANPRPYVSSPAEEGWAAWSPDGHLFYYTSNQDGVFNVWVKARGSSTARQVTLYQGPTQGLPESAIFTKFAVSSSQLIVPVETRKANIHLLKNMK